MTIPCPLFEHGCAQDNHPSFSELLIKLNSDNKIEGDVKDIDKIKEDSEQKVSKISKSTLHSNLKLFERVDLITSFNHGNETRYELNKRLHINIVKKDGSIQDIMDKEIEEHLEQIKDIINKKNNGKIAKFFVMVELE